MTEYDFEGIETRWQRAWADAGAFEVTDDPARPKFYCLEMLPYPSGDIHVGHVRNYCITDWVARYKRMRGFNGCIPSDGTRWAARGERRHQEGVHPRNGPANIAS